MSERATSLLAEIAQGLSSHPETIATRALWYLLTEYEGAWPQFRDFLRRAGCSIECDLTFEEQVWSEELGTPDIVGSDRAQERLVIEGKFWAGLSTHQPDSYLARISGEATSALLFVCPKRRVRSLADELHSRNEALPRDVAEMSDAGLPKVVMIGGNRFLGIVSWDALLEELLHAARRDHNRQMEEDIRQLEALCTQQDQTAFLPLRAAELAPEIGRRVQQFGQLVDETVREELDGREGLTTEGLTTGAWQTTFGRYFKRDHVGGFLCIAPEFWGEYGETPIWLGIWTGWKKGQKDLTAACLRAGRELEVTVRQKKVSTSTYSFFPIRLEVNLTKTQLKRTIAKRVVEVFRSIQRHHVVESPEE